MLLKTLKAVCLTLTVIWIFAAGAIYGPHIADKIIPSAEAQDASVSMYRLPGSKIPARGYCLKGIEYMTFPEGGVTPRIDEKTDKPAHCNF